MSYTLFLLLNVNHDRSDLLDHLAARLERTGPESFCLDESPDVFFSVEYLAEDRDRSLCVDIPFGGEEIALRKLLDLMASIEEKARFQVFDPQIGRTLDSNESGLILERWKALNLEALEGYADGHHFLRNVELQDGRKVMIEAIRFKEVTWQNCCSVALAYNRVGHAAEARKLFEQALTMEQENPGLLYALAVTCFNLRDYTACKQHIEASLALESDNPGARELLRDCDLKLRGLA